MANRQTYTPWYDHWYIPFGDVPKAFAKFEWGDDWNVLRDGTPAPTSANVPIRYRPTVNYRPRYKRKRRTTKGLKAKVPVTMDKLQGLLGIDTKYEDHSRTVSPIAAGIAGGEADPLVFNCLYCPNPGDEKTQREGDHITVKSVHIKGVIYGDHRTDQADPPDPEVITVVLVQDRQTRAAQLNAEDVFDESATQKALAFRALDYQSRYKVLWRRYFHIQYKYSQADGANTASWASDIYPFEIYKKLNIKTKFNETDGGTVADIEDNSLHLLCWGGTGNCILVYESRVRFVG